MTEREITEEAMLDQVAYWKREAELWRDRAKEWRHIARDLADKLDAAERGLRGPES